MNTPNKTNNVFALILVLMISLITSPVFGMSGHQYGMAMMTATSQKMSAQSDPSPHCHPMVQQLSELSSSQSSEASCLSGSDITCSHCSPSHCQTYSGDLPIGFEYLSERPRDRLLPQLAIALPISRTESLLRPPIR